MPNSGKRSEKKAPIDFAERFKGYKSSEILGMHFSIFYMQPDLERNHPAHELMNVVKSHLG